MQNHARLPTPGDSARQLAIDAVGLAKSFGAARTHRSRPGRPRGSVTALIGPNGSGRRRRFASCRRFLLRRWPGDRVRSRCRGRAGGRQGSDRCHRPVLCRRQVPDWQGEPCLDGWAAPPAASCCAGADGRNLERFELTEAADRPVISYSGGMRRRLDLAMTLMGEPRIVFLDEPTTGLDPRGRQVLWRIVRDLVAGGVTVLLTTQYLEEADRLADRVVLIDRGALVAEGTPSELKRRAPGGRIRLHFAGDDAFAAGLWSSAVQNAVMTTCRWNWRATEAWLASGTCSTGLSVTGSPCRAFRPSPRTSTTSSSP